MRANSMTPPRIALFAPNLNGGGAERVMVNLACGFVRRGLSVDLILANADGPFLSEIPARVRILNLRVARVAAGLPALVRYLRQQRPTALLSTSGHANTIALLAKRLSGVPTRVVIRQAEMFSSGEQVPLRGLRRFAPLVTPRVYPWADAIVAGSNGVAEDLAHATNLPLDRIQVAPNPIVTPHLLAMAREPLDHPWFAPGADPVVLGVGRLVKVKDYPTLVRAFALARRERPARLVILGEGDERAPLEALIRELALEDCVALPGFVANPFAFMARAAVFVLSSTSEGLPGALIQALACGVPVIATDCRSGPREVLDGGRFGRLVPVGDVTELARGIAASLDGDNLPAPQEAWSRFAEDVAVERYLRILGAAP